MEMTDGGLASPTLAPPPLLEFHDYPSDSATGGARDAGAGGSDRVMRRPLRRRHITVHRLRLPGIGAAVAGMAGGEGAGGLAGAGAGVMVFGAGTGPNSLEA